MLETLIADVFLSMLCFFVFIAQMLELILAACRAAFSLPVKGNVEHRESMKPSSGLQTMAEAGVC